MDRSIYDALYSAYLEMSEADMKGAPSIKDAKPQKKTDVKYDPHMKVMAPKAKTESYASKKKGLWDNIHAKRKRGESPAKKGDKDYPETLNVD